MAGRLGRGRQQGVHFARLIIDARQCSAIGQVGADRLDLLADLAHLPFQTVDALPRVGIPDGLPQVLGERIKGGAWFGNLHHIPGRPGRRHVPPGRCFLGFGTATSQPGLERRDRLVEVADRDIALAGFAFGSLRGERNEPPTRVQGPKAIGCRFRNRDAWNGGRRHGKGFPGRSVAPQNRIIRIEHGLTARDLGNRRLHRPPSRGLPRGSGRLSLHRRFARGPPLPDRRSI